MSATSTQKIYMIAGVLVLALLIGGGIVMYMRNMRKKSEDYQMDDEEEYQAKTTPPRPGNVSKLATYNPKTGKWAVGGTGGGVPAGQLDRR